MKRKGGQMLSYWSQEMAKIKGFRVSHLNSDLDGQPISIIGFTQKDHGVDLHLIKPKASRSEPVYMDFENPETYRMQMVNHMKFEVNDHLWARVVHFGNTGIRVKSAHGSSMDSEQLCTNWIMAEALRQGWKGPDFDDFSLEQLYISTMTLETDWETLNELLDQSPIRLERDEDHKSYLASVEFELPFMEKFVEPINVDLAQVEPQLEEPIILYGITLRDIWKDFEDIHEIHRARGTFTEAELEAYKRQNEQSLETCCPRGMVFAVVTYEAAPEVSIECYASDYLDKLVEYNQSGSASAMGILFKGDGEVGLRGFPLKSCVIQYPLLPETEKLKFEVFKIQKRVPLGDLVFE